MNEIELLKNEINGIKFFNNYSKASTRDQYLRAKGSARCQSRPRDPGLYCMLLQRKS